MVTYGDCRCGYPMGHEGPCAPGTKPVKWVPEDLDRCEHGRHSIDNCFDCPNGWSTGNLFLARIAVIEDHHHGSDEQVRIGTTLGGEPILVTPIHRLRPGTPTYVDELRALQKED